MFSRSPFASAALGVAGIPSHQDPASARCWRGGRDKQHPGDREPVAPVLALCGLVVFGLPRLHSAGLRGEEPFIVPMHRITMMTTSAFMAYGTPVFGRRVSIRSPKMPSRQLCLPIELRNKARKS